jgi:hypothetical protein
MLIPYVNIDRTDYHDEERAQQMLESIERREASRAAAYEAEGDVYIPRHFKIGRVGSVIFKMTFDDIAAHQIEGLHEYEKENQRAQELMLGRHVLPKHNGGEEGNGLFDGLEMEFA